MRNSKCRLINLETHSLINSMIYIWKQIFFALFLTICQFTQSCLKPLPMNLLHAFILTKKGANLQLQYMQTCACEVSLGQVFRPVMAVRVMP